MLIAITDRDEPGVLFDRPARAYADARGPDRISRRAHRSWRNSAIAAALREAHEEILLDPAAVDLIGSIEPYRTVTGYVVTPVLGVVPPDLPLTAARA